MRRDFAAFRVLRQRETRKDRTRSRTSREFSRAAKSTNNSANRECSTRTRPLFHEQKATEECREWRASESLVGKRSDAHSAAGLGDGCSGAAALSPGVARARTVTRALSASASTHCSLTCATWLRLDLNSGCSAAYVQPWCRRYQSTFVLRASKTLDTPCFVAAEDDTMARHDRKRRIGIAVKRCDSLPGATAME